MKKTKLLLVVLFLISSPLTLHRSRVFAEDSLFDSEIEKQIMEEGAKKAKERAEAKKKAKEEAEKQKEGMVLVEGGTFQMGSTSGGSYEKIIHSVTVSSFYIGKYETTVEEYGEFVSETGRSSNGCYYYTGSKWELDSSKNYKNTGYSQTEKNPVSCVSWNDAISYCNW
jgi:formylglycine-generating enzyme required for sulfatase activity